jgi:hypothetical protein
MEREGGLSAGGGAKEDDGEGIGAGGGGCRRSLCAFLFNIFEAYVMLPKRAIEFTEFAVYFRLHGIETIFKSLKIRPVEKDASDNCDERDSNGQSVMHLGFILLQPCGFFCRLRIHIKQSQVARLHYFRLEGFVSRVSQNRDMGTRHRMPVRGR